MFKVGDEVRLSKHDVRNLEDFEDGDFDKVVRVVSVWSHASRGHDLVAVEPHFDQPYYWYVDQRFEHV